MPEPADRWQDWWVAPESDVYTHGHHDAVLRAHRWRTAENSAAYLLPWLSPGTRLLDVGCGPGTLTVDLARRVAPAAVLGIDVAASVVREASDHALETGMTNVTFETRALRDPQLGTASFDVVHAHQVLQHLRDPVEALATMARLTVPGGIVAARDADYSAMTWAPADPRLERWLDVYLAVTRHNGAEANAGRWLKRWAQAAGLSDIIHTRSTWTFATPSERGWWAGLWAERTVASSFARQAVAYGVATESELALIAAGWREWAAQPDGAFTVPHGEIVARPPGP
jgi:2-polyprenyl-3-methyl-5-hydroxy-6-metoxy-1,4-benzoquinol methylase